MTFSIRHQGDARYLSTLINSEDDFKRLKDMTEQDVTESMSVWLVSYFFTQMRAWQQTDDGVFALNNDSFWKDLTIEDFTSRTDEEFHKFIKERERDFSFRRIHHPITGKLVYSSAIETKDAKITFYGYTLAEVFLKIYFHLFTGRILNGDRAYAVFVDKWLYASQFSDYESLEKVRNEYFSLLAKDEKEENEEVEETK